MPVESSPSSPETRTQQAPSPSQPQEEAHVEEFQPEGPQLEDTSADIHKQTADPAGSIKASVVSSIQTSTAPPQGNIPFMKLLPMNLLPLSYNYLCYSFSRHCPISIPSRPACSSIGIFWSEARYCLETSKSPNLYRYYLSTLDHRMTYFVPFSRTGLS